MASLLPTRERVALVARAIEPILNRVVLAGPPVVELLTSSSLASLPELTFAADATLQLLSTSMVDRLGAELTKLGLTRTGHAGGEDRWRISDGLTFDLVQVHPDDQDAAQVWLEYATLLTLPLTVTDGIVVRIAGAPAMLALEIAAFIRNGDRVLDSAELERAVSLIAGRGEIERELATAPPELRTMVGSSLARLARDDALQTLIRRAIPDTAFLPALARRVRERILRMAC
jgi:hypothetical protein